MKTITKTILISLLAIISWSNSANAQNVSIPDVTFKSWVLTNIPHPTSTTEITTTEAAAYNGSMSLGFVGVYDLTGIEAFTSLTSLDFGYNSVSSVNLSSNTALTFIYCSNNLLTSLDVSSNIALTSLSCTSNFLTSLDLSHNTALVDLYCDYNNLSSLNLQNGNNLNMPHGNGLYTGFDALGNPNLSCIQVDNVGYSITHWEYKDATASFSTNCSVAIVAVVNNTHTIAAGGNHSHFLLSDGRAAATGENTHGALGDHTNVDKRYPITGITISLPSNPPAITAAGRTHSIILKNDGTVWVCGSNLHGELGQGDIYDRWGNQIIASLSNITAISAGTNYSLFLKADGTVWACGSNMYGNLGDGTTTDRLTPVQVTGLTNVVSIAAGKENSLFLLSDGTVWGCGNNANGELGTGGTESHSSPIQISNLTGIVAISEGDYHSIFLKNTGTVWACGKNTNGQCGDNTNTDRYTPVMMTNLTGITAIAAGSAHSISLKNDGTVWGCGSNSNGQLASNLIYDRWGNLIFDNVSGITEIAAGAAHSVFKKIDGTVWACGENSKGQLGDGTIIQKITPVLVLLASIPNLLPTQPIASGSSSNASYFLCSTPGTPYDCGNNLSGQLGDGTTTNRTALISVSGLTDIIAMAGGGSHSLFLKNDGTVWASGKNGSGQFGVGTTTDSHTPVQVHGENNIGFLTGIIAISAGSNFSLFLKNDGTVWACGDNINGQLGDGTTIQKNTPVQISGLNDITAISAGASHSLFVRNNGSVWSCGWNGSGQLGDGSTTNRNTPLQITGLSGISAISGGDSHSLFLKNDTTVWGCGRNLNGELGNSTIFSKLTPVQVHGESNTGFLTGISAVSAGAYYSIFLKNDNTVLACGHNGFGELGDFTTIDKLTPVKVHGLGNIAFLTDIVTIAAGRFHSLFLKNDGTAWTCGINNSGQLGDGTLTQRTTPVQMQYSHSIPTLSASANTICSGSTTTLSIAAGSLNGAANWQWYSGSCGGIHGGMPIGSGASISVSPTITTTYYVRGEGGCITAGNCASITVTMSPLPTLGSYPNKTVVAGRNTTVTPNVVPTNTVRAEAFGSTGFTGILTVNPTTGLLTITDALQAGTYTITVKAFNCGGLTTTRTFTLTVTNPDCSQGKFYGTTNMVVGHVPQSVAVGDFNGDGNQDIVTAALDDVYLNLGNGNGSFGATTHIVIGSSYTISGGAPRSVAVGDFNGDGKQDIAVANEASSTVSIRLGDGTGGFTGSTNVPVGIGPTFVIVGDFNGDTKQDIAVSYFNSNIISTSLGDGNGGFSPYQYLIVGLGPYTMVVGDFNSDGKQDIAVTIFSNKIAVRFGLGDGTFNGNTDLAVGTSPNYLTNGDFNGDGKQDLATTTPNNVSIFIGNGNGSFSNSINSNVGSASGAIAVGDFNGDGKQDIAEGNGNGTVSILSGNGLGTFITNSNVSIDGNFENAIAVGDFNNDSKQDFVTSNRYSNSNINSVYKISVRLGGTNEINVQGNNITIADNDYTPATSDLTNFGSICSGSSLVHTYTIQNTGTTDLTVPAGGMEILVAGDPSVDFTISGITLPATIAAGSSATFDVTFAPTTAGTKIANLSIANDDCNESNYDFNLKGIGVKPTVNQPANRSYCSGTPTSAIPFTGGIAGTIYSWTNSDPSIGLAASGTGAIPIFTPINSTAFSLTAFITVTPTLTAAGLSCSGIPVLFTITVNPRPTVVQPLNQTLCNNSATTAINFTGAAATSGFTWTNNKPSIGLAASGTGAISSFTTTNTTVLPITATITVTPIANSSSCPGTPKTFTITVSPTPTVTQPTNIIYCNGATTRSVHFTGLVAGTTYNWLNNNPSIGLASYGTGDIYSFTATNTTGLPVTATIVVMPSVTTGTLTCTGAPVAFTIIVKPTPTVLQPSNQTFCNNSATTAINFTGGVATSGFTWTNSKPSIGLAAFGTGAIPSFTTSNTTGLPITAAITVTPVGTPSFAYIPNSYTNNVSVINTTTNTVIATIPVGNFPQGVSVSPDGTKVYITNLNSNSVSVISTATNAVIATIPLGYSPVEISVSPDGTKLYITTVINVTVVNTSTNTVTATIPVGGGPNGVSVSPDGTKVYVANYGSNTVLVINTLTNSVAATISVGIDPRGIAVSPDGTKVYVTNFYSDTVSVIDTFTNTVATTIPVGSVPQGVSFSPDGTKAYVTNSFADNVSVISTATNTVIATIVVGDYPLGVSVSSDGTKVYVANVNSNTVSVINASTNIITATIPVGSGAISLGNFITPPGCPGIPATFTITVNPTPTVTQPTNIIYCNGATTRSVHFTGLVAGTTYNWLNNNPSIGLASYGTGDIYSFTATNTTSLPITATIVVMPSATTGTLTCTGAPVAFTIIVKPTPTVVQPSNQTFCNNSTINAINFTGGGATSGFTWTNSNFSIGLATSGTGTIQSFITRNTTSLPITATITVTPFSTAGASTCTGVPVSFTITVNPTPTVVQPFNQTYCNNSATTAINFIGGVTTSGFTWTNNKPYIGLAASGTGTIPSFTTTNTSGSVITATITVTPIGSPSNCPGTPKTFTITVRPTPTVNQPTNQVICSGASTSAIHFTGLVAGTSYNWTNNNTSIGLAASGTGNINSFIATNTTGLSITATITVTPSVTTTGFTCAGTPLTFTITVKPIPTVDQPLNQTLCNNSVTTAINFTGGLATGGFTWTNNNPSIGLAASGTGDIPSFTTTNTTGIPVTATITVTPAKVPFAYMVNYNSNTVSVINTVLNTVLTTIPVGTNPYGVSVSGDGTKVYVTNYGSNDVSVISTATNTVIATIPVGNSPYGVCVGTNGMAYVTNYLSNSVSIINTVTDTVIATVPVGPNPVGIATTGSKVYVANRGSQSVSVIDTVTKTVTDTLSALGQPNGIAVNSSGTKVYVTNYFPNFLNVIDTSTHLVTPIALGRGSSGVAFSPDGTKVYVATDDFLTNIGCFFCSYSYGLKVINDATNTVIADIPLNPINFYGGLSVTPDGTKVYVAGSSQVINTNNYSVSTIPQVTAYSLGNFITTAAGCLGTPVTFTLTVRPTPTFTQPANRKYCSGDTVYASSFIGGATGTTYSWTNNDTSIGLGSSGGNGMPQFTASNSSSTPITATITVTPTLITNGLSCTGTPVTFTITVNPLPAVTTPRDQTVCNSSQTAPINFINTIGGLATWTNSTPSIGLAASGTGDIPAFIAHNTSASSVTATITVTPFKAPIAYIANTNDTVSAINTVTNVVVATIPVGNNPYGVSVSRDGTKVYVTNSGSDNVSVISTATNTVIATIHNVGDIPLGVCLSPNGTRAYVAISGSNSVSVIDTFTNTVIATVPVGNSPVGIAINATGTKVFVANENSQSVSVIQTSDNTVITIPNVGIDPLGIAVNSTGAKVYVTDGVSNSVAVIHTNTGNSVTYIAVGKPSFGVALFGTKVYVSTSNSSTSNLTVINDTSNAIINTIAIANNNFAGISVTPNGSKVYVADGNPSVIKTTSPYPVSTIVQATQFSLGNFITPLGCSGSTAIVHITVNPTPTVTQPANQVICNGASTSAIHFTGLVAGATYNWTNSTPSIGLAASGTGDVNSFNAINNSPSTVLALFTVTPSITTGGLTCTGVSKTFFIAVRPTPNVVVTAFPNATVCAGKPVTLNATGATTYSWSGGITNNVPFIPIATATFSVTGTTNGCSGTVSQIVTVNPLPVVGVLVSPSATVCSGTAVTLSGTGADTYSWNFGITDGIPFTPTATTTYTVTGRITATGCFAKGTSQTITVNPVPTAVTVNGGGFTPCGGTAVLTAVGGTGGTIYWQGTTSGGTATATPSSSQTVSTSGTYYFRSQSAAGCWGPEGSVTITLNNVPTITAGGNTTFCQGGSVVLTSSSATGNTWSNGATTQSITVTTSGSYSVTVSNGSCSATSGATTATVNPVPTTPTITAVGSCEGSTFQWTQTSTPPTGSVKCLATIGTNIFSGTTSGGVYFSPDNGVTWTQRNGVFPNMQVYCLIADGLDLYAGTGGQFGRGVYKSSNNGLSWTDITPSGMDYTIDVRALVIDGTTIFAGTLGGDGIFKSSLNGINTGSWTTFSAGLVLFEDILALAISGTNILAGTSGDGVWISPISSANWTSTIGITQPSSYIQTLDVIGSTVFAGDKSGATSMLYRSTDNGLTWSSPAPTQFANTPIYSIIHHGNAIYAGTVYGAVFMSTNNGVTWTSFNDGFKDASGNWYCNAISVRSLAFIGDRIFAGTDCGVWTSGTCSDAINVLPNGDITFCQGSSVILTSSSATGNTWSNGATTQSITVASSGSYSVAVSNGSCSATSVIATLDSTPCFMKHAQPTSNEIKSTPIFGVKATPNPYSDNFNLTVTTSSEEKIRVLIYDMIGRLIEQREVSPSEINGLQIGNGYPSGVYNIIVNQATEVKTLRVVKR